VTQPEPEPRDLPDLGPAERLVAGIGRRGRLAAAGLILALVLAVTGLGEATGWQAGALPQDNRLEVWFVDGDPVVEAFRDFQRDYALGEPVVVAVHDAAGVFRPQTLNLVLDMSQALREAPRVRGVSSLATALHAREEGEGALHVEPLYETPVTEVARARALRQRALGDPLLRDLVSADETTALLTVQLEQVDDFDQERPVVLAALRAAIEGAVARAGRGAEAWSWGGPGILHQASNEATRAETDRLSGLSALALLGVLLVAFRRLAPVLIALGSVVAAVVLLAGAALALGHRFNLVTAVLPTLVLVVGLIDSVYFVTVFRQERAGLEALGLSRREVVARTLGGHVLPGLFNSLTTGVGFLSFVATRMDALRQLGMLAGLGVGLAFVTSLVVCTLALERFDVGYPREGRGWLTPLLGGLVPRLARRPGRVLAATALVGLVALVGVTRLDVDTHTLNAFSAEHPLRRDHQRIQDSYGPYLPLETIVDTGRAGGALDAELLQGLETLAAEVTRDEPQIGGGVSLARVARRLHHVFGGTAAHDGVPSDDETVAQLLLFYDAERADDPLSPLGDAPAWSQARLTFRSALDSTGHTAALLGRIEARARETLPEDARLRVAGFASLYTVLNEYLLEGLVISLVGSLLLVFLLVALLFRSVRYAVIAVPPNLLPAIVVLGALGALGLPLDPTAAMIGTLVLCVGVDDTVHLLFRFRAHYARSGDPRAALDHTLRVTGRAVAVSSVAVAAGVGVLGLASIQTVAAFGAMTALAMLMALVCELCVTPALLLIAFPPRHMPDLADRPTPLARPAPAVLSPSLEAPTA
jgi:predicted RND superfamily exporter protein